MKDFRTSKKNSKTESNERFRYKVRLQEEAAAEEQIKTFNEKEDYAGTEIQDGIRRNDLQE